MESSPKELKPFIKAYRLQNQMIDERAWMIAGNYIVSAVQVATERVMNGKKSKLEFIKEPILKAVYEDESLTEEERQLREIKKAILIEEQWIANSKARGLPETKI